MSDDDMRFCFRSPTIYDTKLTMSENLTPMIERVMYLHRLGYIHGGIGARQGNNTLDTRVVYDEKNDVMYQRCTRVNNFHFLDRKKVLEAGARFDELPVMEDFHFTLTLMTQGHPNAVLTSYCWNQRGSNQKGGCSTYRNAAVQRQGAEGLRDAFPDLVQVIEKQSKSQWKGMETRADVRISWAKAMKKGGIQ
jgi:hypothetical protein